MTIMQALYAREINCSISTFWDGGFDVKLGDPMNGYRAEAQVRTLAEAEDWLDTNARKHWRIEGRLRPLLPIGDDVRADCQAGLFLRLIRIHGAAVGLTPVQVEALCEAVREPSRQLPRSYELPIDLLFREPEDPA